MFSVLRAGRIHLLVRMVAAAVLVVGLSLGGMAVFTLLDPRATVQQRRGAVAALALFSLPASAAGCCLIWWSWKQDKILERQRLHNTFFQLLQQKDGYITVLSFSRETGLGGDQAKAYLDARAEEFGATFTVDASGIIHYHFPS